MIYAQCCRKGRGAYENVHEHLDGIEIELCQFLRQRMLRAPMMMRIGPGKSGTTQRDRSVASKVKRATHSSNFLDQTGKERVSPHAHDIGARRGRSRQTREEEGNVPLTKADCNSVTVIDPDLSVSTAENQCQSSGSAPGGGPLCGGGGGAYPGYPPPPPWYPPPPCC